MTRTKCNEVSQEIEVNFQILMAQVGRLNGDPAAQLALRLAARLVETAAFESAQSKNSSTVSRLILMAADLERIAEGDDSAATRHH